MPIRSLPIRSLHAGTCGALKGNLASSHGNTACGGLGQTGQQDQARTRRGCRDDRRASHQMRDQWSVIQAEHRLIRSGATSVPRTWPMPRNRKWARLRDRAAAPNSQDGQPAVFFFTALLPVRTRQGACVHRAACAPPGAFLSCGHSKPMDAAIQKAAPELNLGQIPCQTIKTPE